MITIVLDFLHNKAKVYNLVHVKLQYTEFSFQWEYEISKNVLGVTIKYANDCSVYLFFLADSGS